MEPTRRGAQPMLSGWRRLHKGHGVPASHETLRTLAPFPRMAWPLQPCCEKLDDSGDIALIKVTQGSVFCHLNDPNSGIREYGAEQFLCFDNAQTIGVGEIRCRHILLVQDIDIAVQEDGS
jgi:hypothetical protein